MKEHMKERFGRAEVMSIHPPLPKCLNIELNNTCNHKCIFCPFHSPYLKRSFEPSCMPLELAKKILDTAKKQKIGEKEVGFYATGEPLVYKELEQCIAYAKQLGFKYTFITTNGALATPEKVISLLDAGLDSIRFSVNAVTAEMYKEIHGRDDFDKVLENIKFIVKYRNENSIKLNISLSCVLTKKTRQEAKKIKEVFGKLVDEIVFFPVMDLETIDCGLEAEYALKSQDMIVNEENKKKCSSIFNAMYINSRGEVRLCCDARALSIIIADLEKEMDLVAAWNSKKMVEYRTMHMEGKIKNTICENCISVRKTIDDIILTGIGD